MAGKPGQILKNSCGVNHKVHLAKDLRLFSWLPVAKSTLSWWLRVSPDMYSPETDWNWAGLRELGIESLARQAFFSTEPLARARLICREKGRRFPRRHIPGHHLLVSRVRRK